MKILQIIAGIILLLPGICSAGFIILLIPDMNRGNDGLWSLWLPCLVGSALGIWMIRSARNPL